MTWGMIFSEEGIFPPWATADLFFSENSSDLSFHLLTFKMKCYLLASPM